MCDVVQDKRGVCEEALLKVKGVISFTFQMAMKRCTVRVRADVPTEVNLLFFTSWLHIFKIETEIFYQIMFNPLQSSISSIKTVKCTLFPIQSLASAIAATKVLSAQQVVKNESGEEVGC